MYFSALRISVWCYFKLVISLFIGYNDAPMKSELGFYLLEDIKKLFYILFLINPIWFPWRYFYCLLFLLAITPGFLSPYVPSYLCWTFFFFQVIWGLGWSYYHPERNVYFSKPLGALIVQNHWVLFLFKPFWPSSFWEHMVSYVMGFRRGHVPPPG